MTKEEYLESQRGKTYTEIVANQPLEGAVGSIRGENLRDVVAVLAGGLQHRLDTAQLPAELEPLRTALQVAFKHLNLDNYAINLALPENVGMLANAVAVGLVTQTESNKFFELATYTLPKYNITREDCADYFGTGWQADLGFTHNRIFALRLHTALPETATLVIEMQEDYDGTGQSFSEWLPAQSIQGIKAVREYRVELPFYGYPRNLRWKCEYPIDGTVSTM